MDKIKMFSRVRLADGREGDVMEIFGDQEAFIVDVSDPDPAAPLLDDWWPMVEREAIAKVLWEPKD